MKNKTITAIISIFVLALLVVTGVFATSNYSSNNTLVDTEKAPSEISGTQTHESNEKNLYNVTSNTYAGTYWKSTKSDEEDAEYAAKYPGNTPFLQLNEDGTCVFKVFFFHGSTYVNGVYSVEDNKITVELDTDSNPDIGGYIKLANGEYMYSEDGRKTPYMDSSFVFEIVDEDKLKICPSDDSFYNGNCYVVRNGDVFAKKDYLPFTKSDAK